jgi:thiol-disulfide isomerase/thioredoxin
VYFSGLSVLLFSLVVLGESLTLPYIISVIAFPITLYSIYYQAIVIKKWCFLCMTVVAILWSQIVFAVLNINLVLDFSFSTQSVLLTALSFISVFTIWNVLLPKLKTLRELKGIKIKYYKFKRNFNLFNTLLEQSKYINTKIENTNEIVFGNSTAKLQITIVTNPFCGHCKAVQTLVEAILKKYADKVKIYIRFNADVNNVENSLVKITSRLIELYNTNGEETCINAMHNIYNGQDSKSWIKEFGTCSNKPLYFETLKKENKWCIDNTINFTPAILINGKSYPKEYDRSDLIYFIEDLVENQQTQNIPKPNRLSGILTILFFSVTRQNFQE